ncbi:hypothetical protein N7462_000234 [Penicillium macrosclerotiorum]|uniref:uncharacterized protein n=1 Tax=Penicillium macrosclerotiorum TaxID=303699 RepID=UPI002548C90D|nr:uncharacterized protein N7462_000234 [Penicillium macrosclerotiorum]KAJ5698229.1 hypothetical protein N7462_000234 [Penicillium macrosclerotiorum]
MKTSISSDIWEKKKALIAKLYMEEEWPLKQVIKQIRSDDFDPSETQLRSRLKKWRVTKPSRQTRKKPQGSEDPDSEKDVKDSSVSPRSKKASPAPKESTIPRSTWSTQPVYSPASKWDAPLTQKLTPSPSGEHSFVSEGHLAMHSFQDAKPATTSFEQPSQTSPVDPGLMLNTTAAVTPTYTAYPLSPESCIPSPGSTTDPTLAAWPARSVSVDMSLNPSLHPAQWYGMPFEPITPPPGVAHAAPLPPPAAGYVVPPPAGLFPPEFAHYSEAPEYHHGYDQKHWKRAMSLQYDFAGHHVRPSDPIRKYTIPLHSQHHPGMMHMPAGQVGPHAMMCAPIVPYMGQEPMMQKPSNVSY